MGIRTYLELQNFKQKTIEWLSAEFNRCDLSIYTVFFSYGTTSMRCRVWHSSDIEPNHLMKRVLNYIDKLYAKNNSLPVFLKLDLVTDIEEKDWHILEQEVQQQQHNNHYRYGISFDVQFNCCFLEQEIYAKTLIKGIVYDQPNFFDEKNINDAIHRKYLHITKQIKLNELTTVFVFQTRAVLFEKNQFIRLQQGGEQNGIRYLSQDLKQEVRSLIGKNAAFLHGEILETGRFRYGYFPAYDREIQSYNTVRHCTAIYALLESLEVDYKAAYLDKIRRAIDYAIHTFYRQIEQRGFMLDGDALSEIKLGSLAAAIFMLAKYQAITQDTSYQPIAESLAQGILLMVDEKGETTHVLEATSLAVKEKFRIVYYDGEAALGLLRLYQLNHDPKLLATVKQMFEHFITKQYDQYHDHWLSYCTNELTQICPEEKYFQFGLNNYLKHLSFIRKRKTSYSTFLEMLMSAYRMIIRMQQQGLDSLVAQAKFEELKELIEARVEFQRSTGFFYPEMAMYMAKPVHILNAFYVRHDRFRVRIDDQEHNLSGYVAYLNYFEP